MWSAVAGSWARARRLRRRPRRRRHRSGCSSCRRRGRASGCSSWPAGRAASGSRPPTLVGPDGEVVAVRRRAEMTAIAAARAAARGLANVSTRELDLEEIDEPDASYDVVLCREGLMFAADPARAAREIARVLRPGGRAAIAVWGPRERNPWLGRRLRRRQRAARPPIPPPGVPGAVRARGCRPAGRAARPRRARRRRRRARSTCRCAPRSFDEWWTRTSALAGPLARRLESLPEPTSASSAAASRRRSRRTDAGRPRVRWRHAGGVRTPPVRAS